MTLIGHRFWLVLLGVLGVTLVIGVVVDAPSAPPASQPPTRTLTPLPPQLTQALDQHLLKATQIAVLPSPSLRRTLPPSVMPSPDPQLSGTPVPAGYRPDWTTDVRQLTKLDIGGVPTFRSATSIWQNGAVSDESGDTWVPLIVYAIPGDGNHPIVAIWNRQQNGEVGRSWQCPRGIGTLTITGIDGGPSGILSFTASSGASGRLDMGTGQWTFA
jgi:hypothetical protein